MIATARRLQSRCVVQNPAYRLARHKLIYNQLFTAFELVNYHRQREAHSHAATKMTVIGVGRILAALRVPQHQAAALHRLPHSHPVFLPHFILGGVPQRTDAE
jgi:hypothetical protein